MAYGLGWDSVSVLDLYKIWDLLESLEGSRIKRALEYKGVYVIQHSNGILLFSPKRGVSPLSEDIELKNPVRSRLLHEIEGRRIREVSIINEDRVLALDLYSATLVLEWVREGNVVLLDHEGRIQAAAAQKTMKDRTVRRGEPYKPPPRLGDISRSPSEIVELASRLSRRSIISALAYALSLPPELIYEAAYRQGLETASPGIDVKDIIRIVETARNIYLESIERKEEGFKTTIEGKVLIYPFEPFHLKAGFEKIEYPKHFPSYVASLMLSDSSAGEIEASPVERAREALARLELEARLVMDHASRLQRLIESYRRMRESRIPWEQLENDLRKDFPEVKAFNHEKWIIQVDLGGLDIHVNARISAYANAEMLFEKAKSLKSKIQELQEVRHDQPTKVVVRITKETGRPWYRDFRFFVTTNGFLVIAGKSAGQNELLVRRYMDEHDLFLHADIHGAPAVVIKTEGKDVPEQDILEAAQFAASYSSAWKAGLLTMDVYWVPGSQVSKKAPSGEYLGKGAFMIYGKRNWLRGIKLELLIGVGSNGLEAIPALKKPQGNCYVKLSPGTISRELTARKIHEFLQHSCGYKVMLEDILRLLPQGTFHVERWRNIESRL
ncbi:MAG: ribosome rescue protein RqcH [Infirmifilum sp.]|uniref:ribosome rescue protein RqcH n=1 Tax=Infirmifilum TaxID=2856573 RepID=UPI003C70EA61